MKAWWLPVVCCGALAGCAQWETLQQMQRDWAQKDQHVQHAHQQFQQSLLNTEQEIERRQEVGLPWLAGAAQPLARDLKLPAILKREMDTTVMFSPASTDLSVMAERIALASQLPVRVMPEALLPRSLFMPRLSGVDALLTESTPSALTILPPQKAMPLPDLLDWVAHQAGVFWRYRDQAVEFYRTETRSFPVRALTLRASSSASLGRQPEGQGGGFESASSTRIQSSEEDPIEAVRSKLEPFLTRAGKLAMNGGASGLVVVTDTPDVLNRIAAFIDKENKALTRRIRLVFEEVEVSHKNHQELGIDWTLVFSQLQQQGRSQSPVANLSGHAGTGLALDLLTGRWRDSSLLIQALSEVGTVVRHTTVPLQTLNRRPVTHAVRTTFTYIDQVQVTTVASAAGTSTAPSVTQKEETVGSFLTVIPDAQEDGTVLLSIAYDSTVAQPLKTLSFGEGGPGSTVQLQQKTIDGMGTVQQVEVRPGQPVLISGFDRRQEQLDRRRLDPDMPLLLGGSNQNTRQRTSTLIVLTALVEEGV